MTTQEIRDEFEATLKVLLAKIGEHARAQLEYSIKENISSGILQPEEVAAHAINSGIVSAFNSVHGWDTDAAFHLAHDLLEDVNLHDYAKALQDHDEKSE